MGGSPDKLAAHVDGVARGLGASPAVGGGMRSDKRITWEEGRHVGRMSAVVAGDVHVELAAYSVEPAGRAPFIVNLMVTTRAPEAFADVLTSFRP
jgi:hypothetical protein